MKTASIEVIPTAPGTPFEGGFYAGKIRVGEDVYALIVAPKADGDHEDTRWSENANVAGAMSFNDGRANTIAMAEAGSKLAEWALGLRIGDCDDWYLPSRDELEVVYRNLKPTNDENYCWRGDNPSSVPVGYAYFPALPAQTEAEAFRDSGPEALERDYYWSSTQSAGGESSAWSQDFSYGNQDAYRKDLELRARAVRRLKIQ